MGIYPLFFMQNLLWNWLTSHISVGTFQHCLNMLKLNKCAKCLSHSMNSKSMWMELKSSLQTCAKAGLLLHHHCLHFQPIASHFPQLLKCDTDMVASHRIVPYLQRCYTLLVTSEAVHNYIENIT